MASPQVQDVWDDTVRQARLVHVNSRVEWSTKVLMPDWAAQRSRCIVPCYNAGMYEWLRSGPVTTLGELFMDWGETYTAKVIYAFYRTCRFVVLTKQKDSARAKGTPGSASVPKQVPSVRQRPLRTVRLSCADVGRR